MIQGGWKDKADGEIGIIITSSQIYGHSLGLQTLGIYKVDPPIKLRLQSTG